MDDWFIESAVDMGLPVNTVISDRNFIAADKSGLRDTILILPVPEARRQARSGGVRRARRGRQGNSVRQS